MTYLFTYICMFLSDGLPAVFLFLPFYVCFRIFWLTEKRRRYHFFQIDVIKEAVGMLLFCYLMLLFTQTFSEGIVENQFELIPFRVIICQFMEMNNDIGAYKEFTFNVLCNIAVFVPIGCMTAYLNGGSFKMTVAIGLGISLFIESTQIPLPRTTDVDDLILNTTGAVAGYFMYRLILIISEQNTQKKDPHIDRKTTKNRVQDPL